MTASASLKPAAAGKAKLWFGLAALVVLLVVAGAAFSANANQQSISIQAPGTELASVAISLSRK